MSSECVSVECMLGMEDELKAGGKENAGVKT